MKVHPFSPLFVTPVAPARFKKSDTACSPEAPKQTKEYVVQLSKLLVADYRVAATSAQEAERKAMAVIEKNPKLLESISKVQGWEIDDVLDSRGTRVMSKVPPSFPL